MAVSGRVPSGQALAVPATPLRVDGPSGFDPSRVKPPKPLGRKAYGSIPHLPGSRMGPGDHHCHPGQEVICCTKARDKYDRIIVTEKLDGGNVAVAKVDGKIWALGRAGYPAITSPFRQHHVFDEWVNYGLGRWCALLDEGEAIHGEWLAMAHGTRYDLAHEPFVAFDLTRAGQRVLHDELVERAQLYGITTPHVISDGPPITVPDALEAAGEFGMHGALEAIEGAVWRVERKGKIDFLAKFVRPDKQDGKYLTEISGHPEHWHWRPASVDTHPKDGDSTEIEAPLVSGAVPEGQTPNACRDSSHD